jgi:DNA-binding HxlR family transcriptional regulator
MATKKKVDDWRCSVVRAMPVMGQRWTILILREALHGNIRFVDFERNIGVLSDRLADRLATLVEYGVMTKETNQDPGHRRRPAYRLTPAGRELHVLIGALQQRPINSSPVPTAPPWCAKPDTQRDRSTSPSSTTSATKSPPTTSLPSPPATNNVAATWH